MYNPIKNCAYMHSCYVPPYNNNQGIDAVVAAVKDVDTLETKLHIVRNPMMKVWVAKQGTRHYDYKRECALMTELDMYVCEYKKLGETLSKALKGHAYGYINTKQLMESPYVYGADISPEIALKIEYMHNINKGIREYDLGVMDIETSVLGDNQIIRNGYCEWKTKEVHCWILSEWFKPEEDYEKQLMDRWYIELNNVYSQLNNKAKSIFKPEEWKPVFHMCHNERDLIWDSVRYVVMSKPDFLSSWNMAYEGLVIPERAQFREINVTELFAHPDVPPEFRMFKFYEDKSAVEHIADKWHIAQWPGYTYWYDPMCLYGRLRKVKGREVMYNLDYICGKINGAGKVKFGANATHYMMQTKDKVGYCIYNCFDCIQPAILDKITTDTSSMMLLTGPSLLTDFSHQTVQLKAQFYDYCLSKKAVPGSVSGSMKKPYDNIIGNVGGTVLNPSLMRYRGSNCMKESDEPTGIYRLCCDLDVTSFYPSLTIAFNISRETKVASVLWITGCPHALEDLQELDRKASAMKPGGDKKKLTDLLEERAIENATYIFKFFSLYPTITENAVSLCHQHFNLPNYEEMLKLFKQHIETVTVETPQQKQESLDDIFA